MLIAWIRVVAVEVIRNCQNLKIFSMSSQQDLCMEYERKRDVKNDSKVFILSNCKNGVATYWDRKDLGRNRFGRKDQEHSFLIVMKTSISKIIKRVLYILFQCLHDLVLYVYIFNPSDFFCMFCKVRDYIFFSK